MVKQYKRSDVFKRIHITINGQPITKKNHQRIVNRKVNGRQIPMVIPSKQYKEYEELCGYYVRPKDVKIDFPVNVKCLYYMPTRRRVDLVNLLEATCDILVHYGVLEDDNSKIVVSHDGSRVLYDKEKPRAEIWIDRIEEG